MRQAQMWQEFLVDQIQKPSSSSLYQGNDTSPACRGIRTKGLPMAFDKSQPGKAVLRKRQVSGVLRTDSTSCTSLFLLYLALCSRSLGFHWLLGKGGCSTNHLGTHGIARLLYICISLAGKVICRETLPSHPSHQDFKHRLGD